MSKRIYTLLIGIFLFATSNNAQIAISFESGNVNPGGTIEIDVSVTDFTNIASMQYSINWDSLVLEFVEVKNLNPNLPEFTIPGSLNFPGEEDDNLDPGQIQFSWSHSSTNPYTIDDGVLFTITFQAVGDACDTTDIKVSDEPLPIQVVDGNYEVIPLATSPSTVLINGTDCGGSGGGGDDVTFSFQDMNVEAGSDTCIQMSVTNFTEIEGFMFPVTWDTDVLEYTSSNITPGILPGLNVQANSASSGNIYVLWTELTGGNITLDDDQVLFELCFTAVGDAGDMTDLAFDDPSFDSVVLGNGGEVPFVLDSGKVTLTDGPVENLTFIIADAISQDGEEACVEVTALHFNNISSFQAHISFDNTILQYKDAQMTLLPALEPAFFSYNAGDNLITVVWTAPNAEGIDYPDSDVMFKLCFDELVDCNPPLDKTATVEFLDDSFLQAVTGSTQNEVVITPVLDNGSISINCGSIPCILLGDLDHPDCAGEAGGNITVNLSDAPAGCNCVWTKDGNTVFESLTPNCNLLGVTAGTYTITVTCAGDLYCENTFTLVDPQPITVQETITAISCTDAGMIALAVTGGSSPYTYKWDFNGSTDNKINPTEIGTYNVTVTDNNNCTQTGTYNLTSNATEIQSVTISVEQVIKCNGDANGSLKAVPNGGCPSYTYAWSNGGTTSTITGLKADTYTVTITDTKGSSSTEQLQLTEPDELSAVATPIAATGSININVSGGTSPFNYLWSPDGQTTSSLIGVDPGLYDVNIIDNNGCSIDVLDIELGETGSFSIDGATATGDFNGFNIKCGGECSGSISFTVNSGELPVVLDLKQGTSVIMSQTLSTYGSHTFENVCAGQNYIISGKENTGLIASSDAISLTEPTILSISTVTTCPEPDMKNGSIAVTITGGVPDYTYIWDHIGLAGAVVTGLDYDTYNVMVSDANGCQVMESNDLSKNVCNNDGKCHKATGAITPNGDGINDLFVITCALRFDNELTIYSRYGDKVFSAINYDNSWNGGDLPEGGYMWILKVKNDLGKDKTIKGTFAIIR